MQKVQSVFARTGAGRRSDNGELIIQEFSDLVIVITDQSLQTNSPSLRLQEQTIHDKANIRWH